MKSYPHVSQNWPARGTPQRGQASAAAGGAPVPGMGPAPVRDAPPVPGVMPDNAPVSVRGGAPIRMPHTSQ